MTHALTVFGRKCRDFRIAANATMGEQSSALGLTVAEISAIESGERRPSADYVNTFSSWLKLPISGLSELMSIALVRNNVVQFRPKKAESIKLFRKIGGLKPDEIRRLKQGVPKEDTSVG